MTEKIAASGESNNIILDQLLKEKPLDFFDITGDSLKQYIKEVSQIPLLKPHEERLLMDYTVKKREQLSFLDALPTLSLMDEERLSQAREEYLGARRVLVNRNLRLVIKIAKNFLGRGINYEDLIQSGNLGLFDAVDDFDQSYDTKFSTYATPKIIKTIRDELRDRGRIIRLPAHAEEKMGKAVRQGVNDISDIPLEDREEFAKELETSVNGLEDMFRVKRGIVSLQNTIGESGEEELGDFIHDEDVDVADAAIRSVEGQRLMDTIYSDGLSKRLIRVLQLRFGLGGEKQLTLEETGVIIAREIKRDKPFSREAVRQWEEAALAILRGNPNIQRLR